MEGTLRYNYRMKCAKGFLALFFVFMATAYGLQPTSLSAYTETSSGPEVLVTLSPENPGANEDVTATLQSFSLDLDRSQISWYINDEEKTSGPAIKFFKFRMGPSGTEVRLTVRVDAGDDLTAEKTLVMNPANVDLVYEAQTYVPPLYRGKAPPTQGSIVRITAMPSFIDGNGNKIPQESLIYEWQKNFSKDFGASGRGKDIFLVTMPTGLSSTNIKVRVSDSSGVLVAENKLSLSPTTPDVRFYEEHPLLGTRYERALGRAISMRSTELSLRAEPFGLYVSGAPLFYSWSIDGSGVVPHADAKNVLTLRQGTGTKGSSVLSMVVKNTLNSISSAGSLLINFGK